MKLASLLISAGVLTAGLTLSGCSGSGNTGPTGPGVRVINGLTTVSQAYITAGTIIVGSPIAYATISGTPAHPYSIIPTGNQTLTVANSSAITTPVATTSVNVLTTQDIDAVAYNSATPQFLVLYDSLIEPTSSSIRLVNASTATGAVDYILTPIGGTAMPLVSLTPGSVSPAQTAGTGVYTSLATTGNYQLEVFPAGKDTGTPLINEQVLLQSGVTWTFVLLDPPTGQAAPVLLQVQDNLLHDTAP